MYQWSEVEYIVHHQSTSAKYLTVNQKEFCPISWILQKKEVLVDLT